MAYFLSYQAVLDFDNELDVNMLDRVIETFYTGAGAEVCSFSTTRPFSMLLPCCT